MKDMTQGWRALAGGTLNLKKGDQGSNVLDLQFFLWADGYSNVGLDGIFGTRTENALRQFQRKNGLTESGAVDSPTTGALIANVAINIPLGLWSSLVGLTRDTEGARVLKLQYVLLRQGFDPGGLDGDFGAKTAQALVAWRKSKGYSEIALVDEGIVDELVDLPNPGEVPVIVPGGGGVVSTGGGSTVDRTKMFFYLALLAGGVYLLTQAVPKGKSQEVEEVA